MRRLEGATGTCTAVTWLLHDSPVQTIAQIHCIAAPQAKVQALLDRAQFMPSALSGINLEVWLILFCLHSDWHSGLQNASSGP